MSTQDEALIAKQAREKARADNLTDGFIGEGDATLAGHKIRPFTFGSLTLCRRLKLSLFTDEGAADDLDETTVMRQLAVFFWIQSQPVQDVLATVREGSVEEAVDAFEFEIDVHALPAIMKRVRKLSDLASEAAVELEEKPDSTDNTDEPPN